MRRRFNPWDGKLYTFEEFKWEDHGKIDENPQGTLQLLTQLLSLW